MQITININNFESNKLIKNKIMQNKKDILKVRTHDAIVGFIYLISAILTVQVSLDFIWIALVTAALQIVSPLTKFCPVYAILNKIMPDTIPIQNGK